MKYIKKITSAISCITLLISTIHLTNTFEKPNYTNKKHIGYQNDTILNNLFK